MSGEALLDVNVLVALFDPDHVHHDLAHDWFADNRKAGWATCPITENGFVRVLGNPAYGSRITRPDELLARLRRFCASGDHRFWTDVVSLRDDRLFNLSFLAGHRQVTDIYLLGLATKMRGRLVTFDGGISIKAVVGATAHTLEVVAPVDAPSSSPAG
jgi:toxin-antitoxin system PIN domain toxin